MPDAPYHVTVPHPGRTGGEAHRAQPEAGWPIVSDNPDKNRLPTQAWGDDAKIMGEVKWHGQSIKVTAEVTRA